MPLSFPVTPPWGVIRHVIGQHNVVGQQHTQVNWRILLNREPLIIGDRIAIGGYDPALITPLMDGTESLYSWANGYPPTGFVIYRWQGLSACDITRHNPSSVAWRRIHCPNGGDFTETDYIREQYVSQSIMEAYNLARLIPGPASSRKRLISHKSYHSDPLPLP